jgi:hypothetical protein
VHDIPVFNTVERSCGQNRCQHFHYFRTRCHGRRCNSRSC